ncbi:MAG: hypothetical protein WCL00_03495, partial [Bacteroidota bacterium]
MKSPGIIGNMIIYRLLIWQLKRSYLLKILFLLLLICTLSECEVKAQAIFIDEKKEAVFAYDETPVRVMVAGYKDFFIYVLYTNKDQVYVSIETLFKTLGILCIVGQKGDSISGFIECESRSYLIDYTTNQIKVGDKIYNFKKGLIKEMNTIYMESSLFAEAFGIKLTFNYRTQSMLLKASFELPVIKQQRIEKMRSNMSKFKGEEIADTIIKRNYHIFKPGLLDWSVVSAQTWKGPADHRFNIAAGAELFFGETDIALTFYSQYKFDHRNSFYLWRWIDNAKRIIKQAQVGKIPYQTIAFIQAPIVGAVVRNSSTLIRKATGYYTINNFTEPNWTVELYINNVLVGYTTADASGSYLFKVPLVYGYTTLKLKFYGPMGEERIEERNMNVPYTVMPVGQFEYGLSAGIVQDGSSSRFGQVVMNFGVNRFLTIGGGMEYLSSIPKGALIPYATATIQPFRKLIVNGEYAYGVRTRGLLDYYFWKDALLEVEYFKYVQGQLATLVTAPEQRKATLSMPFRVKEMGGYIKLDYTQLVYNDFYYNQGNLMFSLYYKQFSANSSTQLNWIDQKKPYVTSDLALSCRLQRGITLRTSAQYNVNENKFMACRVAIEKGIRRGYLTATYERNVLAIGDYISLSFRYDLPFAQTNMAVSHNNGNFTAYESAQGSVAFGAGNKMMRVSNISSIGKGGIILYPFLDLNNNGILDKGEAMVKLTKVRVNGGKAIFSKKDLIVRISDLNAFVNYNVEFSDYDLENIAWRFKNKRYSILVDPNQFKRVDVPVVVVGEVSGMAYLEQDSTLKGIGRILVKFYRK